MTRPSATWACVWRLTESGDSSGAGKSRARRPSAALACSRLRTWRRRAAQRSASPARWTGYGATTGRGRARSNARAGCHGSMSWWKTHIVRHTRGHAQHPEEAEKDVRECVLRYMAAWRERKLTALRRRDVLDLHARVGERHPTTANRIVQLLRAMFNHAEASEFWHGPNPAAKIKLFHEKKRKRFIQPTEMPDFFEALRQDPNCDFRDFVHLALWTGARKKRHLEHALDGPLARRQPVERAIPERRRELPDRADARSRGNLAAPERRADGRPVGIPQLERARPCCRLQRAWRLLLGRAGLENLRQHDLRRTLGSWQAGLGASLPIIGKSLGHQSQAAVYSQLILDPVRTSVTNATQAMIAAGRKTPGKSQLLEASHEKT